MKIRTRVYLVIIITVFFGVACTAVVNYVIFKDKLTEALVDRETGIVREITGDIGRKITTLNQAVELVRSHANTVDSLSGETIAPEARDAIERSLRSISGLLPSSSGVEIADPRGVSIVSSHTASPLPKDLSSENYFIETMSGYAVLSSVHSENGAFLVVTAPIMPGDRTLGVVAGWLESDSLVDNEELQKHSYASDYTLMLVDSDGSVISAVGGTDEKAGLDMGNVMPVIIQEGEGFADIGDAMVFFSAVPRLGSYVVSYAPKSSFYAFVEVLRNSNAFASLAILILGIICANILAKSIISRLEQGVSFAETVVSGDISGKLEAGRDEIGEMFNAFNTMVDHLHSAIDAGKLMELEASKASRELSLQNARLEILIDERTEELDEAQKHARFLLNMAEEAVIELDEGKNIRFVNSTTQRMLGFTEDELSGKGFFDTIKHLHLNDAICEDDMCVLKNAVERDERAKLYDIFVMGKDGTVIPVSISVSPVDPDDPSSGTVVAVIDLTEPRNQLQEILDSSPTTMIVIRDGEVRHVNDKGAITLGLRPGDEVRKIFTAAEQRETIQSAIDEGGTLRDYPMKVRGANGEPLDVLFTLRQFEYEGKPSRLEWISDVTDLTRAKTVAEDAARARTVFLATMSHEIRTPLNAILGLSEVELRNALPDETHSNIEKIYSSGSTLLSIINDILDVSKIDSGKFDIIPAPYDFANLISDTIHLNVVRIAGKPIKFEPVIDENTPAKLIGDELRLKQILNNLLSNSFKYTRVGTVTMQVRCEKQGRGDTVMMTYIVKDTGIGIKPDDIQNLFAEYRQFDKTANRKIEGTGLGLFICKKLVGLMGGAIEVESEYGSGTTFTVRIAQGVFDPAPIKAETANGLRTFRLKENRHAKSLVYKPMPYGKVLIVDDVVTNLEVARALMTPYQLTIHCLPGGRQAIETIREGKIEYDVIFMDHMMPEIDGIEAVRIIRGEIGTEYAKNVPIIALTANAIAGNEDMFLKNGFQAFVSKPIDIIRLDKLLTEWIYDRKSPDEKMTAIPEAAAREERAETEAPETDFTIEGVDVEEGISRQANAEIYIKILDTYARHTPELVDGLRKLSAESLRNYAITVHGIKGASLNISAGKIAGEAAFLEKAAKDGDYGTVRSRNDKFIRSVEKLISDIENTLTAILGAEKKKTKPGPDAALLRKLIADCRKYDSEGMEKTVAELSQFTYENHAELIEWLTKQAMNLEYDGIADRLENSEIWIKEN